MLFMLFRKEYFYTFWGNSMIQPIYRLLIELTNGQWTSNILMKFARSKASRFIVPSFAKVYQLNQNEMENPLQEYQTLHDLFIRKLKTDARNIDHNRNVVVSPVDAVIEDVGMINENSEIKVKGKIYSIEEMLGNTESLKKYVNGTFMILYLSPSHYHRIHSPVNGTVRKQWTLGTKSYPVNKWGLKYGVRTLAKNYRVITEVETTQGHLAIVKVGAMFVNSIETTHKGSMLEKGEEIAYFSFGSTVVLLFEQGIFKLDPAIHTPKDIKVGEKLGSLSKEHGI
jgi:phosphatidylserine decarboxylase